MGKVRRHSILGKGPRDLIQPIVILNCHSGALKSFLGSGLLALFVEESGGGYRGEILMMMKL